MGRKRQPGQGDADFPGAPFGAPLPPPPMPGASASQQIVAAGALAAVQGLLSNPALASQNPALAQLLASPTVLQGLAAAGAVASAAGAGANAPSITIDPDVQELCDYFNIEERHARRLSDLLRKRPNTFEGDIARLYDVLERAHSPAGLLTVKMREMEEGTFMTKMRADKPLKEIIKKFRLDDQAESKLADILARYEPERRLEYINELERHLEVSNQPSAMTMMLLKKLGANQPLGKPGRVAPGSYLDRKNKEAERKDSGRDRGDRDRDRDRDRERGRDRDRRSRSRSRRR